jgi:hypothetical protein
MSRHCFEAPFSSPVRMMRSLTGELLDPLEATFIYLTPELAAGYERSFCRPVHFGKQHNKVTVPIRIADIPIRMANPGLLEYFENYARNTLGAWRARISVCASSRPA